jgi:hypothetical protein
MDEMESRSEALEFWTSDTKFRRGCAHHRGVRQWEKDGAWKAVGNYNAMIYRRFMDEYSLEHKGGRMIEWGVGGGANARVFNGLFDTIVGIDLCPETLEKCTAQVFATNIADEFQFIPVITDIHDPGKCIRGLGPFEFLLCTAVVQHMPSPDWVEEFLCVVGSEMQDEGVAMIQYWHNCSNRRKAATRYVDNVARWCTVTQDEFAGICGRSGWRVLGSTIPRRPSRGIYAFLSRETR